MSETQQITRLLAAAREGDRSAADELMPILDAELRSLASRQLRRERRGHTLQTTALVNEAYLRLVDQRETPVHDRDHFLALAARTVRRILVDHARRRQAREGGMGRVTLDSDEPCQVDGTTDFVALDAALEKLARLSKRQSRVVELRFFAGLSVSDTARVLGVSPRCVDADWSLARAWLARELERGTPS